MPTTERRSHPRVTTELTAKLSPHASAVVSDISRSGVRCTTQTPLSPMTVVRLLLELPQDDALIEVPCEGVVVRSSVLEGEEGTCYEAAIFFQELEPHVVDLIEAYVSGRISSQAG